MVLISCQCQQCKNTFQAKKREKGRVIKFCSIKCYGESLRKIKKCSVCGAGFFGQNNKFCSNDCKAKSMTGKKLTKEHRKKLSEAKRGYVPEHLHTPEMKAKAASKRVIPKPRYQNEHHAWKGDNAGYVAIHQEIRRIKGTPSVCEFCGTRAAKKYEWANVDHLYSRDPDDYIRLCTKCHRNYDMGNL